MQHASKRRLTEVPFQEHLLLVRYIQWLVQIICMPSSCSVSAANRTSTSQGGLVDNYLQMKCDVHIQLTQEENKDIVIS